MFSRVAVTIHIPQENSAFQQIYGNSVFIVSAIGREQTTPSTICVKDRLLFPNVGSGRSRRQHDGCKPASILDGECICRPGVVDHDHYYITVRAEEMLCWERCLYFRHA